MILSDTLSAKVATHSDLQQLQGERVQLSATRTFVTENDELCMFDAMLHVARLGLYLKFRVYDHSTDATPELTIKSGEQALITLAKTLDTGVFHLDDIRIDPGPSRALKAKEITFLGKPQVRYRAFDEKFLTITLVNTQGTLELVHNLNKRRCSVLLYQAA